MTGSGTSFSGMTGAGMTGSGTSFSGLRAYDWVPGRAALMPVNLNDSREIALMEVGDNADGPRAGQVGLNHMAWRMAGLEDLADFCNNLKEKEIKINRVPDHEPSLGIYPARSRRQRHRRLLRDVAGAMAPPREAVCERRPPAGNFHRPWETDLVPDGVAAANRG